MELIIVHNDITSMAVDAIVLPANSKLAEGPGASAAIYAKAGKLKLQRACKAVRDKFKKKKVSLTPGKAVVTLAFDLESKYIIHAIVPKWVDGTHDEYALLSTTYLNSLALGDDLGCESIAFPLLASGNNGYDLATAFLIAAESIKNYTPSSGLKKVFLVVYGFRAVQVARECGYEVKEFIDQRYVLEKEDELKSPLVKTVEKGQEFVAGTADKAFDEAMAFFENEDMQKRTLNMGKAIVGLVSKICLKKILR